ncbi:serine hydrolase [Luteirhabdus pelagi]|uniref:serine hydrolase n=1 Tax=Luteirhabdus pelagi TaxID=2792783 RepID=UPI00193AA6B0|nr:serine hydrolase [Luteirhabdus pelagi]
MRIISVFLCAFIAGIVNSAAQSLEAELETVFEEFELMGLSILVSVEGVSETFSYGLRDFDRSLPVNDDTHYRIASISKSVVALGMMKLYDEGLFELDDDISSYLGYTVENPNFPGEPITFRMLLSHQSSLQDGSGYTSFLNATYSQTPIPSISEVLLQSGSFYTSDMWRTETPGSFFAYSNINFGLLGTLLEAISGERLDIYMKEEILEPLGIDGSFNIQDINDINDVAVLYRNINGWQPQADNYQGTYPLPPDLSSYTPGTNGAYFAPQGGLRCTAADLGKFLNFLQTNGASASLEISTAAIEEMKTMQWNYNDSNGDNYFGLFNRWGLGLHQSNTDTGDTICLDGPTGVFIGHPGEAYGLISDAYFSESDPISFVVMTNGSWNGYQFGNYSSYYTLEESIFTILCDYFTEMLSTVSLEDTDMAIFPNPTSEELHIQTKEKRNYELYSSSGRLVDKGMIDQAKSTIQLPNLEDGIYFLKLKGKDTFTSHSIAIRNE